MNYNNFIAEHFTTILRIIPVIVIILVVVALFTTSIIKNRFLKVVPILFVVVLMTILFSAAVSNVIPNSTNEALRRTTVYKNINQYVIKENVVLSQDKQAINAYKKLSHNDNVKEVSNSNNVKLVYRDVLPKKGLTELQKKVVKLYISEHPESLVFYFK